MKNLQSRQRLEEESLNVMEPPQENGSNNIDRTFIDYNREHELDQAEKYVHSSCRIVRPEIRFSSAPLAKFSEIS